MTRPSYVFGGGTIESAWGRGVVDSLPPIGMMVMIPADTLPVTADWSDWLLCDGGEFSKTTYAALYTVVGDRFATPVAPSSGSLFRIPNMKGQYPIGRNPGGAYASGSTGARFGSANSVLAQHTHNTGNHSHTYSGATAGATTGPAAGRHSHTLQTMEFVRYAPFAPTATLAGTAPGSGVPIDIYNFGALGVSDDSPDHGHGYSGTTASLSVDVATSGVLESGLVGGLTNANLPPSVVVSFAIRAR